MTQPALSIVAPVYNEARVLPELIARCITAAERSGLAFELVLADDASTDDTPEVLAGLARDERVRPCRLPSNAGQFRATQAGLRAARGDWVVVLDGDLQDPPEQIPNLIDALTHAAPTVLAVLAVKEHRDDPRLFMLGQFLFHRLQHALSRVALPLGAGTFCVMRRAVAGRVAAAAFGRANLSAVIAVTVRLLGGELATISYDKGRRYDDSGRVGWQGLIAEAVESLAVTGALPRFLGVSGLGLMAAGLAFAGAAGRIALLGAGAVVLGLSLGVQLRTRHALSRLRQAASGES